jgi:hypothetical protein
MVKQISQQSSVHHFDHKKAHLTVLGVHRGGGASTEYLQGKRMINVDQAESKVGLPYPTVSPYPVSFSTRMSNDKSPDGCFSVMLHQLRRPIMY